MTKMFTQPGKEAANDLKTLKIVAGSLLAGAAVGLVCAATEKDGVERRIVALIILYSYDTIVI